MSSAEQIAASKAAGVPLWAWGAGVAALIIVVIWWRARSAGAAPAAPPALEDAAESLPEYEPSGLPPAGADSGASGAPAAPMSLSAWLTAASQASGSPVTALAALGRFIAGEPLSPDDVKIVDAAISSLGLPPGFDTGNPVQVAPAGTTVTIGAEAVAPLPATVHQPAHIQVSTTSGGKPVPLSGIIRESESSATSGQWVSDGTMHTDASGSVINAADLHVKGDNSFRYRDPKSGAVSNVVTIVGR